MSSPLIKISDQSWSLCCLCCNCAQEVRDIIKMAIGPAFMEYNHRFSCPHCQTYNQILLTRDMFDNAQQMVFQAPPPNVGGQNIPPFDPNAEAFYTPPPGEGSYENQFQEQPPADAPPSYEPPVQRPSAPSFESAFESTPSTSTSSAPSSNIGGGKGGRSSLDAEANSLVKGLNKSDSNKKGQKDRSQSSGKSGLPSEIALLGVKIPVNNQTLAIAGGVVFLGVIGLYFVFFSGSTPPPVAVNTPKATTSPKITPKATPTPVLPEEKIIPVVEAKMINIPAGEYEIGSNEGKDPEKPTHKVKIDAFQIDIREVTKEEYAQFIQATGYKPPSSWSGGKLRGNGKEPVSDVSWDDATAYAKWAGKRLPTEEEWEVAASGKDHYLYPWGNNWENGRANTKEASTNSVLPAGASPKGLSPFGLYDMCGNVWEWTSSEPDAYPGSSFKVDNPKDFKVIRGGSYMDVQAVVRTYSRNWVEANRTNAALGFRCAKDVK